MRGNKKPFKMIKISSNLPQITFGLMVGRCVVLVRGMSNWYQFDGDDFSNLSTVSTSLEIVNKSGNIQQLCKGYLLKFENLDMTKFSPFKN